MSDDDLFYLQPGFDLNSLTMPRLRSILVAHNVAYPASSKKPQLVQIVTDEVLPKARTLLNANASARTKRTSNSITDMRDGANDDDDEEPMPPPPAPKTPRSRKSKSNLASDNAGAAEPSTSRRSRTPGIRKGSSKHPRAEDTETEAEIPAASARKSRKSQPGPIPVFETPTVKIEEPDRRIKRESLEAGESPFSDENPFQLASSPNSESRRVSSTSRTRKSLGTDRRKSTSTGRRTQTTSPIAVRQEDGIRAPSRSTFEFPGASLRFDGAEVDELEPTEEFAPEAARELEKERAANGQLVRKGTSALTRRRKKTPTSTAVKVTPWAILTMLGAAFGAWYRQEKINIGYCGVGQPNWSLISNSNIPEWVHEKFQPICEPCPQHAICYPNMEAKCEDDFLLIPHPLSLAGIIPLPPTCQPDSEKSRRIKIVADRAVEELRDRRAAYECGHDIDAISEVGAEVEGVKTVVIAGETKPEIAEETLKREVGKMRKKGMTAEEFEELWRGALGEIMDLDEVVVVKEDG
jgi:Man1-Src1p-C-terminal domain/HeH/LEM domain